MKVETKFQMGDMVATKDVKYIGSVAVIEVKENAAGIDISYHIEGCGGRRYGFPQKDLVAIEIKIKEGDAA